MDQLTLLLSWAWDGPEEEKNKMVLPGPPDRLSRVPEP